MNCFITFATNDTYAISALVLNRTIKKFSSLPQIIIITSQNPNGQKLSKAVLNQLKADFNYVIEVPLLSSSQNSILYKQMNRPELLCSLTKIHIFNILEYLPKNFAEKLELACFLDADTIVVSEKFEEIFGNGNLNLQDFQIYAAPEFSWPDTFNSGVLVFRPRAKIFQDLLNLVEKSSLEEMTAILYDGGDQSLFNHYFQNSWGRMSVLYNLPHFLLDGSNGGYGIEISSSSEGSPNFANYGQSNFNPAFSKFGKNACIIHFLGHNKPWNADLKSSNTDPLVLKWNEIKNLVCQQIFIKEQEQEKYNDEKSTSGEVGKLTGMVDKNMVFGENYGNHEQNIIGEKVSVESAEPLTSDDIVSHILDNIK